MTDTAARRPTLQDLSTCKDSASARLRRGRSAYTKLTERQCRKTSGRSPSDGRRSIRIVAILRSIGFLD